MSKAAVSVSYAASPASSPLVFKPTSAWAKGPPRSLSNKSDAPTTPTISNSSNVAVADGLPEINDPETGNQPLSPMTSNSTSTPALTTIVPPLSTDITNPSSPKEIREEDSTAVITNKSMVSSAPPPRPKRNPLRRESSAESPSEPTPTPNQPGQSPENSSASDTPTQSITSSATSQNSSTAPMSWSSFLAQTKTISSITTEPPPVPKERRTRSRSTRRDQTDDASVSIPLTLPPMPSYPPPLPPAPPSASATLVKSKLQVDAQPFVPALLTPTSSWSTPVSSRRTTAAIIIKRPDGEKVDIRKLSNVTSSATPSAGTSFSVAVPRDVKLESEEERKKRLAAESGQATAEEPVAELMVVSPSTTHESTEYMPHSSSHEDNNQSQDSAIDEEDEGRPAPTLNIPILATNPPTAALESAFPISPLSSGLNSPNPNTNAPPLTRPRRERSRRGSKRGDSANRNSAVVAAGLEVGVAGPMTPTTGLSAMTRTRSGGLTRTRPNAGEIMSRTRSSTGETRTRAVTGEAMMMMGTRSGEGMTRTMSGEPRRRPGRLDLSVLPRPSTVDPGTMTNPLANAKPIVDLDAVVYPEGVATPNKELNEGVEDGKFRYDREFILQFRGYCTERPPGMEEHEGITLAQPIEQPAPTPTRSRRRRSVRSNAEPLLPTPILTGSTLVVPVTAGLPSAGLTAEEQLLVGSIPATPLSATFSPLPPGMGRTGSRGGRSRNGSNAAKMAALNGTASIGTGLPPPFPMMRSKSHGSPWSNSPVSTLPPSLERRTGSQRPQKRSASIRNDPPLPSSLIIPGLTEEYKPLEVSANRWTPSSLGTIKPARSAPDAPVESEEIVEKKVKGLLNKLTLEKFDSISDQIVSWANKSERETNGATLQLVIRLVFDKATDEAAWSAMYAQLCRKMMEQVSTEVRDENVNDRKGEPIVGGQLFRQYLLSRCQADFERGWSTRETLEEQQSAAAAAAQESAPGEMVFSDEYYALQKAKRRGLGLVKFIGELFKLGMLTERIMQRCILKLLDEPAEDDIESVCQLLKTVGAALSGSKGKESMDMYFERMRELSENMNISQRIRFMLRDVMDLRARGWVLKNQGVVPSTLAQVHEAAAKEANEKSATSKPIPIVRNGSRRGQNRSETGSQKDGDSWISTGLSARSFSKASGMPGSLIMSQSKIDDTLKSFGAVKSVSSSSGGFHSLARLSSEPGTSRMSRQPSEPGKSRSKRGGGGESKQVNRRTSVDFAHLDAVVDSGSAGRKRLQLLPRSVAPALPSSNDDNNAVEPTSSLAATFEEPPSMTEEQARVKVEEDLKEFMQIRDLEEAVGYFESLPSDMRYLLVDKFVTKMDSKEPDVVLICELFERVASSGLCSMEVFEQGFAPTIEALDDIALDVPPAYTVMARLLRASKLPREVVDRLSGTINIYDTVLVHPRGKLMKEFDGTA